MIRLLRILEYECTDQDMVEIIQGANNFVPLNGTKIVSGRLTIRSAMVVDFRERAQQQLSVSSDDG